MKKKYDVITPIGNSIVTAANVKEAMAKAERKMAPTMKRGWTIEWRAPITRRGDRDGIIRNSRGGLAGGSHQSSCVIVGPHQ